MKKILIIVLLGFFAATQAQVTFKPGIRAGLNFSHFTKGDYDYFDEGTTGNDRDFSSKTDFYFGVVGTIKLTKYYTLQPEVNYSRQGTVYKNNDYGIDKTLNVSYLSIALANKFTLTDKFNIHAGPTIDFQVDSDFNTDSEVDLAFFLGAGYNFTKKFGVEARIKKGFIPVLDYSDGNHANVVFSLGANYTFDLK